MDKSKVNHDNKKIITHDKQIKKVDKELRPEDLKNVTGGSSGGSVG
jgi:hypothetical protein